VGRGVSKCHRSDRGVGFEIASYQLEGMDGTYDAEIFHGDSLYSSEFAPDCVPNIVDGSSNGILTTHHVPSPNLTEKAGVITAVRGLSEDSTRLGEVVAGRQTADSVGVDGDDEDLFLSSCCSAVGGKNTRRARGKVLETLTKVKHTAKAIILFENSEHSFYPNKPGIRFKAGQA
jgi:hypothetical protein